MLGIIQHLDHDVGVVASHVASRENELPFQDIGPITVLVETHGYRMLFLRLEPLASAPLVQMVSEHLLPMLFVQRHLVRQRIDAVEESSVESQDELFAPHDALMIRRHPHARSRGRNDV